MRSTRSKLEEAHKLAANTCGELALVLERGRELTSSKLREMSARLVQADQLLRSVLDRGRQQ